MPPTSASPFELDALADLANAEELGHLTSCGGIRFGAWRGRRNLWIVAAIGGRDVVALRSGHGADELTNVAQFETRDGLVFEFASAIGALRAKVVFPEDGVPLRCTTSLLPSRDLVVSYWPRDLYAFAPGGTVHTMQRGIRSGIVFASTDSPVPCSLFYFQDFSSLTDYFEATKRSPSACVGGRWPELGYAPPAGEDCVLPKSRETVISDAYLIVSDTAPVGEGAIATAYLDQLAAIYMRIVRPDVEYHDWPARAEQTLRDVSVSPECTYVRRGKRYVMPYVADGTKPPESMVQLTLTANLQEYDRWRDKDGALTSALHDTVASFFDEEIGTLVRWLPGENFGESQAEANMNHHDMDSWYLHHALFNLSRLARSGDVSSKELFGRSLPFAIRAARRFDYRWPIFFDLRTLDVVRAESEPGKGGENDVAGLYALVMIHAHELFGDAEYLGEAERAVLHLRELGFALGYQMNTTGFAAEAALRLWKRTRDPAYLELSEICMANLFDNMWLWRCDYGRARHYRTFFGLFPLRDAPYLAAYEELEAFAKFREYLALGGDDVRPSLRLLLAEYQRYSLDRSWYYYPDTLPRDVIAEKSRNGCIRRNLSVPIEDLHDGHELSGQVGQELYGAGLALVYSSRHYVRLPGSGCIAFCDYPMYDFGSGSESAGRATWRVGGDPRGSCELRVIPQDSETQPCVVEVTTKVGKVVVPLHGRQTPEGHAAFSVRGGQTVEIRWQQPTDGEQHSGVEIGAKMRSLRPLP